VPADQEHIDDSNKSDEVLNELSEAYKKHIPSLAHHIKKKITERRVKKVQ
jgi:hypothetical protein